MTTKIRKAAVLGAGVMGAQIAALLSAAGIRTYLLDLKSNEAPEDPKAQKLVAGRVENTRSILAIENLKALKPSPILSAVVFDNLIPGNFEDDMSVLSDVDWVIEAVIERLDIKKDIHQKISQYVKPNVPVTTNTSGIKLTQILEGLPEHYQECFFGTHFFNPPRYMKLLEIIPHEGTDRQLLGEVSNFIEQNLGKGIVYANDTVNFIANRVGVFNMQISMAHMADLGLNLETVDSLTGKLMGRPKSATFRTADVVGLDTFIHVAKNVYDLVDNDPYREVFKAPAWLEALVSNGALGQKTGAGCYKKSKDKKGKPSILSFNTQTLDYGEQAPENFEWLAKEGRERNIFERLWAISELECKGAQFVWKTLRDTFSYAALLLDEIASGSPKAVDEGMMWGFNWEWGPFALWQGMGYDRVLEKMKKENVKLPDWCEPGIKFYSISPNSGEWHLSGPDSFFNPTEKASIDIIKRPHEFFLPKAQNDVDKRVVSSNPGASLVDIGDGIACLTFHSKMNAVDNDILKLSIESIELVKKDFNAMIVANEGPAFSAGANLKAMLDLILAGKYDDVESMIRNFQAATSLLKYSPFPTVTAPFGMVLGGGAEFAMHGDHRIVAAETYAGLVELGVGLIPAGGGTKELAVRSYEAVKTAEKGDPMPFLQRAFELIGMAKVSTSGFDAVEMGLFPKTTTVSISKDHIIYKAKRQAQHMYENGYITPTPQKIKVVGDPGIQTFKLALYNMKEGGMISEHDALIGEKIATVLCGGEVNAGSIVTEDYLLELERRAFMELCHEEKSQERIAHMLKAGKALRN